MPRFPRCVFVENVYYVPKIPVVDIIFHFEVLLCNGAKRGKVGKSVEKYEKVGKS